MHKKYLHETKTDLHKISYDPLNDSFSQQNISSKKEPEGKDQIQSTTSRMQPLGQSLDQICVIKFFDMILERS